MKIAVDARLLELNEPTGVERAFRELLTEVPSHLSPKDQITAFVRHEPQGGFGLPPRVRVEALGGPRSTLIWRETSLVKALAKLRPDVLWSPVEAMPLLTRTGTVATFYEAPWAVRRGLEGLRATLAHRVRTRIAARRARRVVCASHAAARQFGVLYPHAEARLRVVPLGVAPAFLYDDAKRGDPSESAARPPEQPYFLHVGGDRPRKNVPFLFDAYRRYRDGGGAARLLLAGPGRAPAGLPSGGTFLGYVSDRRLRALYDEAIALLVSSASEGFGLPVLEAMARGTPVISVRAGALDEVAAGAALLIEPGDAYAMARTMGRVEEDPGLRASLSSGGRARTGDATFARAAGRLVSVLREAAVG